MPRTFDIRYRWTLDDYEVLSKAQARLTTGRRSARLLNRVLSVLLLLAALYYGWMGEIGMAVYFLALVTILVALQVFWFPSLRKRQFAHQRLGDSDIHFRADDNGFSTRSDLAEGTHKWIAIRQVDDLPGHVLLWPNNRIGWMIPKRAFASPEEAADFAKLAKEKTAGQTL